LLRKQRKTLGGYFFLPHPVVRHTSSTALFEDTFTVYSVPVICVVEYLCHAMPKVVSLVLHSGP